MVQALAIALVLAAAPAAADPALAPAVQTAGEAAQSLRQRLQARPVPAALPQETLDTLRRLSKCGPFGVLCSDRLVIPASLAPVLPLNRGFQALGPTGKTGKIDGPGRQGNGKYAAQLNSPMQLALKIETGYIRGVMTLTRDATTGADTMRFEGRLWGDDDWGPPVDKTSDVSVTYDAGADRGAVRWREEGQWKQEAYWGGKAGGRRMVIELGGGWDHDFAQD